jgi:hypothetical protein
MIQNYIMYFILARTIVIKHMLHLECSLCILFYGTFGEFYRKLLVFKKSWKYYYITLCIYKYINIFIFMVVYNMTIMLPDLFCIK